jgi:hypothetical protein
VTDTRLTSARSQAAAILIAWNSDNPAVLHRHLESATEDMLAPPPDTGESERLELVGAIATTMRVLLESGERSRAAQYLPLLRHLASPPPAGFDLAYRC